MRFRSPAAPLAASAALLLCPAAAPAADHLDSPSVETNARLDINDIYAFQSPSVPDTSVLVMTVIPAAGMLSPTTLSDRGAYDLMIDNNGDALADITYTFLFGRARGNRPQSMVVLLNGRRLASGVTGRPVNLPGGGRLLVALREDPFFFDLNGFNRLTDDDPNNGGFDGTDFFAGLNVVAMILEVPSASLTAGDPMVGVFARTTERGRQFDRMGLPGINTVLIPNDPLKNAYNDAVPVNDPENFQPIFNQTITDLSGGNQQYADMIAPLLAPDILPLDTSAATDFSMLNGRALPDDVIDIELQLLSNGNLTTDGVPSNDTTFPGVFPYLNPPFPVGP